MRHRKKSLPESHPHSGEDGTVQSGTPLEKQLALLTAQGYRVVTVSQLLKLSPFRDVLPSTPEGAGSRFLLERGWGSAFSDNLPMGEYTLGQLGNMLPFDLEYPCHFL